MVIHLSQIRECFLAKMAGFLSRLLLWIKQFHLVNAVINHKGLLQDVVLPFSFNFADPLMALQQKFAAKLLAAKGAFVLGFGVKELPVCVQGVECW